MSLKLFLSVGAFPNSPRTWKTACLPARPHRLQSMNDPNSKRQSDAGECLRDSKLACGFLFNIFEGVHPLRESIAWNSRFFVAQPYLCICVYVYARLNQLPIIRRTKRPLSRRSEPPVSSEDSEDDGALPCPTQSTSDTTLRNDSTPKILGRR